MELLLEQAEAAVASEDWTAAETTLATVLEQQPRNAIALRLLAWTQLGQGKKLDAVHTHTRAVVAAPTDVAIADDLARMFEQTGHYSDEVTLLRKLVSRMPTRADLKHRLVDAELRLAAQIYDRYAPKYDEGRTDALYPSTAVVCRLARAHAPSPIHLALDLGCGTGACGTRLSDIVPNGFIGIDASRRMLERAKHNRAYRALYLGSLTTELAAVATGTVDLAVAAGSLMYQGDLAETFHSVARTIRRGGIFVFDVLDGTSPTGFDVLLGPSKYAHLPQYISHAANVMGFDQVLRHEGEIFFSSPTQGAHAASAYVLRRR